MDSNIARELEIERQKSTKLQQRLDYYERFDLVSGLYNRTTFHNETRRMLLDNQQKNFAMLRMDIENFKLFNELWGREEGDKLLRYLGEKLRVLMCTQHNITFARTDADIFHICFLYSENTVRDKMGYIEKILSQYDIDYQIIPYFGIYEINNHEMPINLMCDRANLALRTVKGNYMKRFAYYDDKLRKKMLWEQEIINQMPNALMKKEFELYLQPQCNIQSGRPISAEVLVRWIHPERGRISPGDFIPIFEKNGLIMKLDAYVLEETCILLKHWIEEGRNPHPLSVNVSRVTLFNPKLCDIIINMVEKYGIPPKLLELEITESAYSNNQKLLIEIMERLQNYGFKVLMDDFGSGYSSLNMLKEVIVDILKLDLAFLAGKSNLARGRNILASVLRMAKWLNLVVIAEGVETKEQVDFLRSIGCMTAQGYYYAKPMPIAEYETYVEYAKKDGIELVFQELEEPIKLEEFWEYSAQTNLLFNNMVGAIGVYESSNGAIEAIRLNDCYYEMMKDTPDSSYLYSGKTIDRIWEEDKDKIYTMFEEALKYKQITQSIFRRKCKDGSIIWIQAKTRYLAGDKERSIYFVVMNDITQEKNAEKELEKISQELKLLVNCVPGGIFKYSADEKGLFTYVSENMLAMLEYTLEEFQERFHNCFYEMVYCEDRERIKKEIWEQIAVSCIDQCEYRIQTKSGALKWFLDEGHFIVDGEGKQWFYVIIVDITKQKESRENPENSRKNG